MRVLVIGSGAREHAICWRLRQSKQLTALFCAPGNAGIADVAQCVPAKLDDIEGLLEIARANEIDLTIVGPELPLSLGVVDAFRAKGHKIFGPTAAAAQLEASKIFAKEVMEAAGVSTAKCKIFNSRQETESYLATAKFPVVLKADGLAAGKGVVVCMSAQELPAALDQIFGSLKSQRVLVEDFLTGNEVSYIVATDGIHVVPFASSHDYKRLLDGQRGPNTGGMGAVSPSPFLPKGHDKRVVDEVILPVLQEMKARGISFSGFLYAGLMIGGDGRINVLEFNTRLGDPECQVLMRRLESDLIELITSLLENRLPIVRWSTEAAVGVVLAAAGYPHEVRQGDQIGGLEFTNMFKDAVVFHGGTQRDSGGNFVTAGGRVLTVTAMGPNVGQAAQSAYKAADVIQYRGRQLRRDVGSESE